MSQRVFTLSVLLILSSLGSMVLFAQGSTSADPYTAVVIKIVPPASVQRVGTSAAVPLQPDQRLYPGDRIICGEGGYVSLVFADTAVEMKLLPNTELTIEGQRITGSLTKRVRLQLGKLLTRVFRGDMEVATPTCVASVKGTRWWTTVDPAQTTQVIVLEGEVRVENRVSGAATMVSAGSTASSFPTGQQQVAPTRNEDIPSESSDPQQGSLQIEFNDESGQTKSLQIDFTH